jgi:hypothetical protein
MGCDAPIRDRRAPRGHTPDVACDGAELVRRRTAWRCEVQSEHWPRQRATAETEVLLLAAAPARRDQFSEGVRLRAPVVKSKVTACDARRVAWIPHELTSHHFGWHPGADESCRARADCRFNRRSASGVTLSRARQVDAKPKFAAKVNAHGGRERRATRGEWHLTVTPL